MTKSKTQKVRMQGFFYKGNVDDLGELCCYQGMSATQMQHTKPKASATLYLANSFPQSGYQIAQKETHTLGE